MRVKAVAIAPRVRDACYEWCVRQIPQPRIDAVRHMRWTVHHRDESQKHVTC